MPDWNTPDQPDRTPERLPTIELWDLGDGTVRLIVRAQVPFELAEEIGASLGGTWTERGVH